MSLRSVLVLVLTLGSLSTLAAPPHAPGAMQSGRTRYFVNIEGTDCIETRNVATAAKLSVSPKWIRTTKQVCDDVNEGANKKD